MATWTRDVDGDLINVDHLALIYVAEDEGGFGLLAEPSTAAGGRLVLSRHATREGAVTARERLLVDMLRVMSGGGMVHHLVKDGQPRLAPDYRAPNEGGTS